MLSLYARFVVRHSYFVLFTVSVLSTVLTVIPLVCRDLPSFSDPIVGFETRGTQLAQRFIAWHNLIDETRPSGKLAVNPKEIEDQIRMNQTYYHNRDRQDRPRSAHKKNGKGKGHKRKKVHINSTGFGKTLSNSSFYNITDGHVHWGFGINTSYEDENIVYLKNHTRKQWLSLIKMQLRPDLSVQHNYASGNKCGPPISDYAHLVITTMDNTSLLTFENVYKMCIFQSKLIQLGDALYYKLCQRSMHFEDLCCPVWSVPNYIALISGKDTCEKLNRQDVETTMNILKKCAGYFHNFTLMATCDLDRCKVPKYCSQYDAVYNMLFYLIDSEAFSPPELSKTYVRNVMLFLPLPSSSTVLPYYMKLQSTNLSYDTLTIPAIEFGLKNSLFDLWVIEDTWLIGLGGLFVFFGVWVYTKSLLLTLLLFTAIGYSLGISYFLYVYVFNLAFFPFMNLLVIVIVIGIGADDAFLFVKMWQMVGKQLIKDNVVASEENGLTDIKNYSSAGETILIQILTETMKHSIATMFITTATTAVAFFASYVSYIPAINCFSVFAGTAVLVNFFLMVSCLPASVFIVDVKLCCSRNSFYDMIQNSCEEYWDVITTLFNQLIIICITRLHIVFILVFGVVGLASIFVVFYVPGLQLPDSKQFQLFQTSHPFEQYDINYKEKFLFERFGKDISSGVKMPLRWIWGIKALDNGNHMDPASMGHLVFDENFSISDPKSQIWLLKFCAKLKRQPFYQHTLGPLLPNCFIESFKMFMSRRCVDNIDKIDRRPCCETSKFPYKKDVFEQCITKAIESLYQTSREIFMPGVAGPKFLRKSPPKVSAVVVEFESVVPYSMSYKSMNEFFLHVENWTQEELKSAPKGMKCGWFISDLEFYDLQRTLASGTVIALLLSAGLGCFILIPATQKCLVSICALLTIGFSSTVTMAILVLSDWKLNVLESVAISTSAGLAVDFSLHYALSYTNANGAKAAKIKYALSASAGPTAAAAVTTGFAGIFLLRSHLLPYSQIGTFLALIMTVSWTYATFFLCSLLFVVGSSDSKETVLEDRKSVSRVSSICSGVQNLEESHELEHLADSNPTNLTRSQSPSSISATTVVLHDDYDNIHSKIDKKSSVLSNLDHD